MPPRTKQLANKRPHTRGALSSARQSSPSPRPQCLPVTRQQTSSSSHQQTFFDTCFRNNHARTRYNNVYARLPIRSCQVLYFPYLRSLNFPYLPTIERFRWTQFLSLNCSIRENLICAFFSNALFTHDGNDNIIGIRSYLSGHEFVSPLLPLSRPSSFYMRVQPPLFLFCQTSTCQAIEPPFYLWKTDTFTLSSPTSSVYTVLNFPSSPLPTNGGYT